MVIRRNDVLDFEGIKKRLAEFDEAHGQSLVDNNWILYEDGAARETNPLGALIIPPSDPWERAKRIAYYRQLVLQRAVDKFHERRDFYLTFINANLNQAYCPKTPFTPEQATKELEELRKAVRRAKRQHQQACADVEANTPERVRMRREQNTKNRQENESLLTAVRSLEV
jgi:hypothetical protein